MIYEFALEPSLLNSWDRFCRLTEQFGVCHGRLISRYPKRWKAMVYDSLHGVSEMERKRIEVRLQGMDEKMKGRVHHWNQNLGWLQNAEEEHERQPFHAIIAGSNPRGKIPVLVYDDLEEETPLWAIEPEKVVSRDASSLAKAVGPLIRAAKSVIFVDPYFDPYKPRVRSTLQAFLEEGLRDRIGLNLERVEFHTGFRPEIRDFVEACKRELPMRIPVGVSLKVVRWRELARK